MAKNISITILLFILLVGFSGCKQNSTDQAAKIRGVTQNVKVNEEVKKEEMRQENDDTGNQVAQAGIAKKCSYSFEQENEQHNVFVLVDGEKFKLISKVAEETEFSLFDGEAFFSWADGDKQGMKMSSNCSEEMGTSEGEKEDPDGDWDIDSFRSVDEILNQENVEMVCESTDEVEIRLPTEIEFVDQCELLRKQMELIKELQT